MSWFDALRGIVEAVGVGDELKRAFGGDAVDAYASGRSLQTDADVTAAYTYERVLTRPRDPSINDR